MLDVSAVEGDVVATPMDIRMPGQVVASGQADSHNTAPVPQNTQGGVPEHPYSVLSRYVYQRLYAPERLWDAFFGVEPVKALNGYYPLYEGGAFATQVLGTWRYQDFYATVISMENRTSTVREIDPRRFRGSFKARSGHIFSLMPKGTGKDVTAFVLISDVPFEQALPDYVLAGSR
jgi:hypothetical protein